MSCLIRSLCLLGGFVHQSINVTMVGALGRLEPVKISQELETKGVSSTFRRGWSLKGGYAGSMW